MRGILAACWAQEMIGATRAPSASVTMRVSSPRPILQVAERRGVRRTSRVLHALHIPKQWRIECEDAPDVLSKGCRHQPFSPRDVYHLAEGNLLDLIGDLLALRLIGRAHPVGDELLGLRNASVHAQR